jgi:hypothetical protein
MSLSRSRYLNVVDGEIDDRSAKAFASTILEWSRQPVDKPLTIVLHFHGGLVDFNCGVANAIGLSSTYEPTGALPYFILYNVGMLESLRKGDASRGLFKLSDNRAWGLLSRIGIAHRLSAERTATARGHQEMTEREDWFREGMPFESLIGRYGLLAWAYMKQTIVDGLDLTRPESTQAGPLDESCNDGSLTPAERDPWPHIRRGTYRPTRAGTRAVLCALSELIDARASQNGITNIVLVGHSTGAIYVNSLIRKARRLWSSGPSKTQRFDVILLAPAVTYHAFTQMIIEAGSRVRNVRIFTMQDVYEQQDWVLSEYLESRTSALARHYQKSLLYAVSGIFEPVADEPLLGLARFQDATTLQAMSAHKENIGNLREIQLVNAWFERFGGVSAVYRYSPTYDAPVPFATCTYHHGDFVNPGSVTMASVAYLITQVQNGSAWERTYAANARLRCPAPDYPLVNPLMAKPQVLGSTTSGFVH